MNWTLEKIQGYIEDGVEESLYLEYKILASLENNDNTKNELAKDVSAFANCDGGEIIYGVHEKNHKPVGVDNSPAKIMSRESIENVINSKIRPKIEDIKISPVDNPNSGNQLVVISVPKSDRAPHMANQKYHKRYNFQSTPMEHYEVEDVRNRKTHPNLILTLLEIPNCSENKEYLSGNLEAIVTNKGNVLVEYYMFSVIYPQTWKITLNDQNFHDCGITEVVVKEKLTSYKVLTKNFCVPHVMPLWKDRPFNLLLGKSLKIDIPVSDESPLIVMLSCPDAQDKGFYFYPKKQNNTISWYSQNIPKKINQ